MNLALDNDVRKRRLATGVKWGLGLAGAAIIAPAVFLAIQGLIGLMVAGLLGLAIVNLAPVAAMRFANWKLQGLKAEARSNPIETRQNLALQARERLRAAGQELTTFAAEVMGFADEVKELRRQQPEDAAQFDEQLRKMQALLEHRKSRLAAATAEAAAFEAATERAARKWKVAQSAIRMQMLAGEAREDAMNKLLAAESLDAVQTAMNRAMAELDTALATTTPVALPHDQAPNVIDIHSVEVRERVGR